MLVSIVIPAFNEEKYLPKTLESLSSQAPPGFDYEVIVVDSSSTDKTSEVATRYGARVINIVKKTPAFARQKGIELSRGEIIICLDADTLAAKDLIETVASEFLKDSSVVGLTGIIAGYGGNLAQRFLYQWSQFLFMKFSYLLGKPGFHGQCFAFRKTSFMKINGFRTELYTNEDLDLGLRMSKIGKIKYLPKILGISSIRRIKEGVLKGILRGFFSYMKVIWKLPFGRKEKEPFPAIR